MKLFKVHRPGLFTTIQDLGRYGFQRYGVPVSGAVDSYAFQVANLLVKNNSNDAGLEITLQGPELEFLHDNWIAITGANLSPMLNGEGVTCWQTQKVQKGDILSFGRIRSGCRAYLAIRGGINVPVVMNSRSTFVRGGLGGIEGRTLKQGDVVTGFDAEPLKTAFTLPSDLVPSYSNKLKVEVVLGPQSEYFTNEGLETFLSSEFTLTTEFDRMGNRYAGPPIEQITELNMVSDAIPPGSIQIPPAGKPVVIMRDAQITGGYPKIGVITTPDISLVGQAKPNDRIRFSKTSLSRAKDKHIKYLRNLQNIKHRLSKL
jgi:antagonist of KipI